MGVGERPPVSIFRETILPISETFIRRQALALERYAPTLTGLKRTDGVTTEGLPVRIVRSTWQRPLARIGIHRALDRKIALELARQSPALVHAHFITDAARVFPACRRRRISLIVTAHGFDAVADRDIIASSGPSGHRMITEWPRLVDAVSLFIAVAEHVAERLVGLGVPHDRVVVHHIGVPLPTKFRTNGRPQNRILFVGRLVEKKGVFDFLDAAAIANQESGPLEIRLVGDGPLLQKVKETADRLRLDVTLLGAVPEAVVAEEMHDATVLVVPSIRTDRGDSEGLPTVACEAMAAGLPIVGYDTVGLSEAVIGGVTGVLVPESDKASLGSALSDLLRDPDRRERLARKGRRRAEASFEIRSQTRELERIYDAVAARDL